MSVIERVKTEQTVDVFQTVKLVRAKRPGAVNTLVSKKCHDPLLKLCSGVNCQGRNKGVLPRGELEN